MVFKYTETGYVLETIRRFQKQFSNQRTPCRQTRMDNYNKYVQYGLNLNRKVGNSGRPRTARTQANIDMVRKSLEAHPLTKTLNREKYIFALSTESGQGYFTPTFSIMHNFCSGLSI